MMTKFCTQCGAEVGETQKFCNKCGTRLLPTQPTDPAAGPAGPPFQTTVPPQGTAPTLNYTQAQQQPYQPPPPASAQMPYQTGYMPPAPQQPPYGHAAPGLGLAPNIIGALCYLPILAIVFLVLDPYNKDRFVRFHAWQSIFYVIAWIALRIALGIMNIVLPDFLIWMMSSVANLGFMVGWVWLIIQAYQNKTERLPVIGDLAAQQVR
jgi:uncharacterized membrane protein